MSSIIKVDTIQTAAGGTPTAADLGLNTTGSVLNAKIVDVTPPSNISITTDTFAQLFSEDYTPVSSNSTILVRNCLHLQASRNTSNDSRFDYRVLLNDSQEFMLQEAGLYDYGGGGLWSNLTYVSDVQFTNTTGNVLNIKAQAKDANRAEQVAMYAAPYGRSTIQILEIAG